MTFHNLIGLHCGPDLYVTRNPQTRCNCVSLLQAQDASITMIRYLVVIYESSSNFPSNHQNLRTGNLTKRARHAIG